MKLSYIIFGFFLSFTMMCTDSFSSYQAVCEPNKFYDCLKTKFPSGNGVIVSQCIDSQNNPSVFNLEQAIGFSKCFIERMGIQNYSTQAEGKSSFVLTILDSINSNEVFDVFNTCCTGLSNASLSDDISSETKGLNNAGKQLQKSDQDLVKIGVTPQMLKSLQSKTDFYASTTNGAGLFNGMTFDAIKIIEEGIQHEIENLKDKPFLGDNNMTGDGLKTLQERTDIEAAKGDSIHFSSQETDKSISRSEIDRIQNEADQFFKNNPDSPLSDGTSFNTRQFDK